MMPRLSIVLGGFWMIYRFLLLAMLAIATPAHSQWREATSANFIVYSEGSEAEIRAFATKLEKFNFVLRTYHGVTADPSPNRLRVFLMPTIHGVQRYAPGAAGFYIRRARGPMMVGTRRNLSARGTSIDPESVLLHEYTHHFMYQYFPATYPTWYSEGFAEFWGATRLLENDVVEVGQPANYRYGSFAANRWLHARRLLTAQSYADVPELDLLYAQGWLLVRYMFDDTQTRQQVQTYLNAINSGRTYQQAMDESFDDLGRLNSDLFSYAGRRILQVVRLPFRTIDVGDIAVRTLGPAEQALVHSEILLSRGIPTSQMNDFARDLRNVAGRFPDDPHALRMLVETERLAGDNAAALAAADRLLSIRPDDPRGLMYKGLIEAEALRSAGNSDEAAWDAARASILRANRAAPNDPLILEAYYDSFAMAGTLPPESAQNALFTAMERAPSDDNLRYRVAADFEQRGMIEAAIATIRPAAYVVPHRGDESERERRRREELEDRYRMAGTTRRETAREMYDRLRAQLGQNVEEDESADDGA